MINNSFKQADEQIFEALCAAHCYITNFLAHALNRSFYVKPIEVQHNGETKRINLITLNDKGDMVGVFETGGSMIIEAKHSEIICQLTEYLAKVEEIFS